MEVYGLHNREIGGSILQEGDTRVFFLRIRKRVTEILKSKRSVATVEKKKPNRRERRKRKSKQPSSLLILEQLLPARVSVRVLTELDQLAEERQSWLASGNRSSAYQLTTQSPMI